MADISPKSYTAFSGTRQIASGYLRDVAYKASVKDMEYKLEPIRIFDDATGEVVDIAEPEINATPDTEPNIPEVRTRVPGRPRLGVVGREVTLLPRHWEWLASQPGGASVALRKLVEQARRANQNRDRLRLAQEAALRFMSEMAGNEPGFEEATRALYLGNCERFAKLVEPWPIDVANHAKKLAGRAFECLVEEQTPDAKPRYTLAELLAKSDYSKPQPPEEREWIDAPALGRELI